MPLHHLLAPLALSAFDFPMSSLFVLFLLLLAPPLVSPEAKMPTGFIVWFTIGGFKIGKR